MATSASWLVEALGLADLRMSSWADFDLHTNPFWTSFVLTLIIYPILFYVTWYLNPSLSKNRLGLSWVLGLYSAAIFTICAFYEIPHVRTIWNCTVDKLYPIPGSLAAADLSDRHRAYQAQMQQPHLLFSLENYPDPSRIGPSIIAANFQAFLVLDLLVGLKHYRDQMGPFSTWTHHIVYYYIVVHMKRRGLLDVFCALGTPIEASSVFLAWGYMFPEQRGIFNQIGYVMSFVCNRLFYVAFMWHEVFFNLQDKSVRYLYTLTLLFHMYWFAAYIHNQRRYGLKKRRQHVAKVLGDIAVTLRSDKHAASHRHQRQLEQKLVLKIRTSSDMDNRQHNQDNNTDPYNKSTKDKRESSTILDPRPLPQPRSHWRV